MDLIIDIGANVGNTVSRFIKVSNKVVCFEPNPTLSSHLKNIFSDKNVVVDNRGVSNKNGSQTFNISNANTISTFSEDWIKNSRFTNDYNWDKTVEVETITLDSIIELYGVPDYIKIDIEGYEYEVLTSFNTLLPNTLIAFEWAEEQKDKIKSTLEHLNKLGYNLFGYTESDEILFDEQIEWFVFENFKLTDKLIPERKEKWGMIYFKK